jgi:hypothetical protein
LSAEVGSLASGDLAAEGSAGWSQRSEYEVGVGLSSPCEDVSPEAEELPPLEAFTKQCEWGY